jgi:16S rRNA (guanine527-N7)-methyltransferase
MSFPLSACDALLRDGLSSMELELEEGCINKLLDYLKIFHQWNQAYNLSAIRDPEEMVLRHLLDSLTLVPHLKQHLDHSDIETRNLRLLDVGTGGGLPGIPLAIVFPNVDVTLIDSNGKKTRFLFQTALQLGLKNIIVENNRVEKFSPADKFDIVSSRAFASLQDMAQNSGHLLTPGGEYWAMKGIYPEQELSECANIIDLKSSYPLVVPGVDGERHLLMLVNKKGKQL